MAENKPEKKAESKVNSIVESGRKGSKFIRDCRAEINKIIWPAPKTVFKNTGVVLMTIVLIGLFIFGLDTVMMKLLGLIMNISG